MLRGDCLAVLADMEPESVHAIVTDPPYEIGFMGRAWDATGVAYDSATWAACLRVLKPGGHLLSFGATRTYHGIASAVERAGFEVRDCLSWLYGSGFPKSLDVSKAIDKATGTEPVARPHPTNACPGGEWCKCTTDNGRYSATKHPPAYAYATPDAERWQGWGTALKPAWEPILLARKPLVGTVAANVLRHGTGALNVDGCRVGTEGGTTRSGESDRLSAQGAFTTGHEVAAIDAGRWPANVTLDAEAAAMLDEQSGETRAGDPRGDRGTGGIWSDGNGVPCGPQYGDTDGASRFFYVAKPSSAERSAGLPADRNAHPTVKPIELMRWLCRLITPPGGTILDPFTGSGTTGCAAVLEGFDFIGCEMTDEYADIADARIAWWAKHAGEGTVHDLLDAGRERDATAEIGQASIFDLTAD